MMHEIKMTTSTIMRKWVAQRTDTERTLFVHSFTPHFIPIQKNFPPLYPDKAGSKLCPVCHNLWSSFTTFPPPFFFPSSPLFKQISEIRNSDWRRETYKSQPNFELASRQRGKLTAGCHFSLSVGENFIISTVFSWILLNIVGVKGGS